MTPENVVQLINEALMAAFWVSAPLLMLGFAVGIVSNLIQVATSLQDAAISTVPRLAAFLAGIVITMPWMLKKMTAYTVLLLSDFSRYAR